jgi:hypothetical protein
MHCLGFGSAEGGLAIDVSGRAIGMTVFGPRRRVLVIPSATGTTLDGLNVALAVHALRSSPALLADRWRNWRR